MAPVAVAAEPDFHETVFDAIPSPVFIVDRELCIVDFNAAAAALCDPSVFDALHPRAGDALQCVVAEYHACGQRAACVNCAIRNSVIDALQGDRVSRRSMRAHLRRNGSTVETDLLITTAPFRDGDTPLALLIVENLTELLGLRAGNSRA